eukprot:271794-Pyramimonas_sp.AAC.1
MAKEHPQEHPKAPNRPKEAPKRHPRGPQEAPRRPKQCPNRLSRGLFILLILLLVPPAPHLLLSPMFPAGGTHSPIAWPSSGRNVRSHRRFKRQGAAVIRRRHLE